MAKYKPTMPARLPPGPGTAGKGSVAGTPASTTATGAKVNPAPYAGTSAPGPATTGSVTAATQATAPSPNPGVGTIPKGGTKQVAGQPPLAAKR